MAACFESAAAEAGSSGRKRGKESISATASRPPGRIAANTSGEDAIRDRPGGAGTRRPTPGRRGRCPATPRPGPPGRCGPGRPRRGRVALPLSRSSRYADMSRAVTSASAEAPEQGEGAGAGSAAQIEDPARAQTGRQLVRARRSRRTGGSAGPRRPGPGARPWPPRWSRSRAGAGDGDGGRCPRPTARYLRLRHSILRMTQDSELDGLVRQRIRGLRVARGWSLDDLAARCYLSPSTVSRIETGHRRISLDQLSAIARALGTTLDQLVESVADDDVVIRPQHDAVRGVTTWMLPQAGPHGVTVAKMRAHQAGPGPDNRERGPSRPGPGSPCCRALSCCCWASGPSRSRPERRPSSPPWSRTPSGHMTVPAEHPVHLRP